MTNLVKELQPVTDMRHINMYRENVNIILYVANETEFTETFKFLVNKSGTGVVKFVRDGNMYHIGNIGLHTLALVKGGNIGQEGVYSSVPTIENALRTFYNTDYIITVGVCGGYQKKISTRDVIVAYEMINYESQKIVDGKIIDRSQGLLSVNLGNILSSEIALMDFGSFHVHYGKVLSGNKVVSDKLFAEKLLEIHPDVMALDMEGYSIARAAITNKLKDWIFVKSPSDFLYEKIGSNDQDICTRNALKVLERLLNLRDLLKVKKIKVLISGAYTFDDQDTSRAEELSYLLSQKLIENNYKLISGYGMCIGNAVVAGVYNSHSHKGNLGNSLQDYIEVYPFPRIVTGKIKECLNAIKYENRQLMAKGCTFTIFLYGKKSKSTLSEGMNEEFRLASNSFVIPVGWTGYKAKEIWEKVNQDFCHYYPENKSIRDAFAALNNPSLTINQVVDNILYLMELLKDYYFEFKA